MFQILWTGTPPGLRLVGQVDLSHRPVLEQALHRAVRYEGDLYVDVSALEFIDVGGVRLLIDTAAVLALDGRKLMINGPRPVVLRSLRICGWDTEDNISILTGSDGASSNGGEAPEAEPRGV